MRGGKILKGESTANNLIKTVVRHVQAFAQGANGCADMGSPQSGSLQLDLIDGFPLVFGSGITELFLAIDAFYPANPGVFTGR